MSLPYRFRAGGSGSAQVMAPINPPAHHHRSTTKSNHKPFKSRFATKSALKDLAKGKSESQNGARGGRRTPHQEVMSKLARRNQARQLRIHHNAQKDRDSSIFQGKDGASKHIAVVPLHSAVNTSAVIKQLNDSVDARGEIAKNGFTRVDIERFGRNLLYMPTTMNTMSALDICRLADWVIIVLRPDQPIDDVQDEFLRTIEGQGITNVATIVQDLEATVPPGKRSKCLAQMKVEMAHYFSLLDKLSVSDNKADCANLVRSLCTVTTKGINWRDERSWMLIEDLCWEHTASEGSAVSPVTVTGTVRGRNMNPDRVVHIPGWGEYQVGRITVVKMQNTKRKADEMEESPREWLPSANCDDLDEFSPPKKEEEGEANRMDEASTVAITASKGVLLDDHHYFSDDLSHIPPVPKKLPQGTSSYQAAWYLDDISDSESDVMDEEDDNVDVLMDASTQLGPEAGAVWNTTDAMTEGDPSEYPESEMHVDADDEVEAQALEEFRANRKAEAEEDVEFPDEVELHANVLARERLAKYRGLKSLRTSEWNIGEDVPFEPVDYKHLLQVANYKKSKNAAMREALAGGAPAGTRVAVQLLNVPVPLRLRTVPASLFSLLRHEHKQTVVNLNMTLHSSFNRPLKSKEELVVQIGPRRLVVSPVFSAGGVTPNNVHKFDRFLHPGRTAVATFTGPLTWGSVPVLVFKRKAMSEDAAPGLVEAIHTDKPSSDTSALELIGTATTVPPSHSRVIAKRVILTGHPYKIHKKLVTIRYMFFNTEDVAWFKALPLWTKRGRQGFIKESLGTHGYFKATFDGKINPMDAVGVSLYKRVWPRPSRPYVAHA